MTARMDAEQQQGLAAALFNDAWTLLNATNRSPDEDALLVHTAHASLYHWAQVGTMVHQIRGEWQVSRAYAEIGRAEPALWHATRALRLAKSVGIVDWDLAFCFEALARAHAIAGDLARARSYVIRARAVRIDHEQDRAVVEADLSTVAAMYS